MRVVSAPSLPGWADAHATSQRRQPEHFAAMTAIKSCSHLSSGIALRIFAGVPEVFASPAVVSRRAADQPARADELRPKGRRRRADRGRDD